MNEQDITLLLDIKGKCNIKDKYIIEMITNRLDRSKKNNIFYSLNSKSVCIILNNLYKVYTTSEKHIVNDIYEFYIDRKLSHYTLQQLIIVLYSLCRYNYQKSKVAHVLNYVASVLLNRCIEHTGGSEKLERYRAGKGDSGVGEGGVKGGCLWPFRKQDKYELILFYTLSCYYYCNNDIILILAEEMEGKLFSVYSEKEICMLLSSICNFLVLKKVKGFEKHFSNEDIFISEQNKRKMLHMVDYIISCKKFLQHYSHFSLISIYIFFSKLGYFCEKKKEEDFFLKIVFSNVEEKNENKNKLIFFSDKEHLSLTSLINLLFALTLNMSTDVKYYNTLLRYVHVLIKDNLTYEKLDTLHAKKIISQEYKYQEELNKLIRLLTVQNIQLLCVTYTYLFVYNLLCCEKLNAQLDELITQKVENEMLLEEVKSLEDDAVLHKLIGLILVREEKNKCYDTITRRIHYICGEIESRKKVISNSEEKLKKLFSDLESHSNQRKIAIPQT
ncbi:conserved Plasmodium protein, unknown function [Plasmodium ovale wallikeri]|uniref:Uncharacterized protein n=1 Tax=Plasmodium ovale wallikeri TaxID=864142 RepID=A0A1A8YXW4_PLAOA|nr:conserved Plasmodium protein, unknown function [Plasmodium ovale wallikeri]SBT55650.1 conserved Plasmodium protein, unknown function [Plasmodium ovale wallikeri]